LRGKVEVQSLLHSFHLFIIKYRKLALSMIEVKYEKLTAWNLYKMHNYLVWARIFVDIRSE